MQKYTNIHIEKDNRLATTNYNGMEDNQAIYDLMEIMRTVKTTGKEARLNAMTISGGNGGRII